MLLKRLEAALAHLSEIVPPGSVQTDVAIPILPTALLALSALSRTSSKESPSFAAAPATYE